METKADEPSVIPDVSEDVYYSLDEDSGWQYLGGELVREPASFVHEDISDFLRTLVRIYLSERGGGIAVGGRFPMRLDPKWSPEPDLQVVREERRHLITAQRLEGPADLVIEIASSSDPRIDLRRKLPRYREARIPEIWMIDPYEKSLRVETFTGGCAGGYDTRILAAGRLASTVLPGFWIEVGWLWQEPLPPPLACLRQIFG
jgi:Uma2 family endonuclease